MAAETAPIVPISEDGGRDPSQANSRQAASSEGLQIRPKLKLANTSRLVRAATQWVLERQTGKPDPAA